MPTVSKKDAKPRKFGLSRRDYPRNVRSYFDYDYLDKLSAEEREFLSKFNECHYGASYQGRPPAEDDPEWPVKARRVAYGRKNAVNQDLYSIANSVGNVSHPDSMDEFDGETQDWSDAPRYLADSDYQLALEEYRAALDVRPVDPVRVGQLRRRLEKYVNYGQAEE